ncbi:hypothetical protein C8R45DRAFT_1072603 [Mycena sanguinolenta]|nr:hypothetical protein C8R45DRAFT_1072603 [Mycena sanguinolenta]
MPVEIRRNPLRQVLGQAQACELFGIEQWDSRGTTLRLHFLKIYGKKLFRISNPFAMRSVLDSEEERTRIPHGCNADVPLGQAKGEGISRSFAFAKFRRRKVVNRPKLRRECAGTIVMIVNERPSVPQIQTKLDAMSNGVADEADAEAGMKGKRKIDKWLCRIVVTNRSKDCEFKANRRGAGVRKRNRDDGHEQRVKLEAENQAQNGDVGCVRTKRGGGKAMETTDRIGGYDQEVTGEREGRESEESERGRKAVNDRSGNDTSAAPETQRNAQTWREESELEVDSGTTDWSCRRIEFAKSLRAGGTGESEG